MTIRIVEAPGIKGDILWTIRTNTRGGRSLQVTGPHSKPDKTYWYVVREQMREYPFGAYTTMHYNAFTKREDAEEYASWHKGES